MDQQADGFRYLPEAIEQISHAVSDAARPWRPQAEQAKLLADAARDAADVLERMRRDEELWEYVAVNWDRPISHFRLPLTPELLTGLGYGQDEAERLVAEGNRMLRRLTSGPAKDRAARLRMMEPTRQTVGELAAVMQQVAEQADVGIEKLEHRQGQIRRLRGLLYQVVQVLSNIAVSITVSAMFTPSPPPWASSVWASVAELRQSLGDGTLFLLTFAAAEHGARIATALGQPAAASLAMVRAWVEPSWRPLSPIADPHLVQELEKLVPDLRRADLPATSDQLGREDIPASPASEQGSGRQPVAPEEPVNIPRRPGAKIPWGDLTPKERQNLNYQDELDKKPELPYQDEELPLLEDVATPGYQSPRVSNEATPSRESEVILPAQIETPSGITMTAGPSDATDGQEPEGPHDMSPGR